MKVNKNQVLSLLSILCFVLLMRTALILYFVEPAGYVIDIYSMFPLSFYVGLILCYLIGSFLLLNRKKVIGTLVLSINHLEILLIPYMLGYYSMGRADDMSYIGEYLQIVNSGHIAGWNIYPASHIIGAGISIISNVEPHLVSFIIPIVFSFIFVVGAYLFSRIFISTENLKALLIASSFILYLGTYNFLNVPNALFFAFMPLYLYVMYSYISEDSTRKIPFSIIFVLTTLLIPYTHPFVVFFVMMIFLCHILFTSITTKKLDRSIIPGLKTNAFILLFIAFFTWFFYQGRLVRDLIRSVKSYINEIGRDPIYEWTAQKAGAVGFDISDWVQMLTFFYGRFVIPTLIIIAGLIFIYWKKVPLKKTYFNNSSYIAFLYISSVFTMVALLVNPVIIHQPDRILNLNFIVYAQIPLLAIALHTLFFNKKKTIYNVLLVCMILTSIWTISFFGTFDSPNVSRPNAALSYNEVQGMSWFADYKGNYPLGMPLNQAGRYQDILGFSMSEWNYRHVPANFGYNSSESAFSDIYFDKTDNYDRGYVIVTSIAQKLYSEVPNRSPTFVKEDFMKIKYDTSMNKVYDSLNINILYINNYTKM